MDFNTFPKEIRKITEKLSYQIDEIGESDSTVVLFDNMVLKIEKSGDNADREYNALKFLDGKLPVPEIICFQKENGYNYLLMSKLKGVMACSCIKDLNSLIELLADGLKQFWSVDITDCTLNSTLDKKLKAAKFNIDNDLVDIDDFEENTIGVNGFKDINALYNFLINNKPKEDLVFTHGDYCLPNVFSDGEKITGFLDLGKAGIADRWQDIAPCVRSLKYNICSINKQPEQIFLDYKNKLYNLLGIEENSKKLKYYILLDELF